MAPEWLLVLRHGAERVGLDLECVREITRMLLPRKLPGAPPGVMGFIDLRGEIIPAIDLERRLPAGGGAPSVDHHMVIVEAGVTLALAVSHVEDIETIPEGCFRAASTVMPAGMPLLGMARGKSGLVPVLDPASLMSQGEIRALRNAVRGLGEQT